MVLEAERVLIVDVDTDDVALPSYGSAKVMRLEVAVGLARLRLEDFVAALAFVLGPGGIG